MALPFPARATSRSGISLSPGRSGTESPPILKCSFLTISGNHITGAGRSTSSSTVKHAISLAIATNSLIQNNVLDNNTSAGVYLAVGSDNNTVDYNIVGFNASGYTDSSGAYHRLAPGIDVRGSFNIISNNISHDNDDFGIQLVQGANLNIVVNNVTYHNKDYPNSQAAITASMYRAPRAT